MSEQTWQDDYRKKMYELHLTYPAKIRERLATGILRRGVTQVEVDELLQKTAELEERLKAATPKTLYEAGAEGEIPVGRLASALYQQSIMITGTWLYIEDLEDGALYAINARNASLGIWSAKKRGFEIARTKFQDTYIFVEYHWDCGPPHGTARPSKKLEPARQFKNEAEKLSYLVVKREQYKEEE